MKFSIITPSYNQGQYIKDTLESVISFQSNISLEHIVVDGGSTDETVAILSSYSAIYPNLIWSSSPDHGQSDAINKGLKLATGDIVAYINSDDYYLPDSFRIVMSIFEEYPEVDFIYGDMFLVNSEKLIMRSVKSTRTSMWQHLYVFGFPQQTCFWRRKIINKIPEFNINNKTCMDREYFAHMIKHKITFCRISQPIACFRIHENSITGSGRLSKQYQQDQKLILKEFSSTLYLHKSLLHLIGKIIKQIDLARRSEIEIFSP